MRNISNLKVEDSIVKRRLMIDEDWTDKFNRFTVFILFAPFIFLPICILYTLDFISPNDEFILHWVLPSIFFLGVYIFYRNATEMRLINVNTQLDKKTIKKLLLEFAQKNQYEIYRKSNSYIILNDSYSYWGSRYKKTAIIFFQDNLLLFTVIRDGLRLNLPTLLTHLVLKRDLNKTMKKAFNNLNY